MNTTPVSLLERLHDPNDQVAKLRLIEFCQGYFFHWATKTLCWSKEEAEDFVQDLFVIVLSEAPKLRYDPQRRFRGWLFTIAHNLAASKRRQWDKHPVKIASSADVAVDAGNSHFDEQEFKVFLVQRARKIMEADFEPTTLQAFHLLVCEGKSGQEVAVLLGISPAAVYMAKSRVLQRLREELQGIFD